MKDCILFEGFHAGARKESDYNIVSDYEALWTDHNFHFPFPWIVQGEEVEEGGWGEGVFSLLLVSYCSSLFYCSSLVINNKLY